MLIIVLLLSERSVTVLVIANIVLVDCFALSKQYHPHHGASSTANCLIVNHIDKSSGTMQKALGPPQIELLTKFIQKYATRHLQAIRLS